MLEGLAQCAIPHGFTCPRPGITFWGRRTKSFNCNKKYKAKKMINTKVCSMRFFYQVESEDNCAIFRLQR